MFGGKGQGVDAAKLAVRPVLDEFFDRAHRFRLCRLTQSIEQRVGFAGKIHDTIGLITVPRYPVARKNGKQVTDAPNILLSGMPFLSQIQVVRSVDAKLDRRGIKSIELPSLHRQPATSRW